MKVRLVPSSADDKQRSLLPHTPHASTKYLFQSLRNWSSHKGHYDTALLLLLVGFLQQSIPILSRARQSRQLQTHANDLSQLWSKAARPPYGSCPQSPGQQPTPVSCCPTDPSIHVGFPHVAERPHPFYAMMRPCSWQLRSSKTLEKPPVKLGMNSHLKNSEPGASIEHSPSETRYRTIQSLGQSSPAAAL